MSTFIRSMIIASSLLLVPVVALAQQPTRPATPAPATGAGEEIKLDESTTLKAAALEARISAVLANFALLQRQAQDLQQEMTKMLEERKTLIQDAGKKATWTSRTPTSGRSTTRGSATSRCVVNSDRASVTGRISLSVTSRQRR
jgi:hypothetical protein